MRGGIVECVPNFSEGRDRRVVESIANAIASTPAVAVLNVSADADHHRSVITFAGPPDAVAQAAVAGAREAVRRIDLNRHSGVHPRIGAVDVIPFVPVEGVTLGECAGLAEAVGQEMWDRFRVPVYLYEAAARQPERVRLEQVRKLQFEGLRQSIREPAVRPDIGDAALHPTAGATAVGARKFLIAFNVNLDTFDLDAAKTIARKIRASSGGLPHVKALGLPLASRNQVQVSMNLTDYEVTPLHVVFTAIAREAAALGIAVAGSELIGLIPRRALEASAGHDLRWESPAACAVFENSLERLPLE